MKTIEQGKTQNKTQTMVLLFAVIAVIVCVAIFVVVKFSKPEGPKAEVVTVSTLEKIINVSELSTFTAVYNGIAEVANEKKPEKIDYYVSYKAKVTAGIDFEQITITVDNENKVIHVDIPEVFITDVNVDITSLDFIFYNEKANTSTVSQTAFKACEEDAKHESQNQNAIFELAKQNAQNILTALIKPVVEQLDSEYKLVVE